MRAAALMVTTEPEIVKQHKKGKYCLSQGGKTQSHTTYVWPMSLRVRKLMILPNVQLMGLTNAVLANGCIKKRERL